MTPGTIIASGYPLIDSERQSLAKRIDAALDLALRSGPTLLPECEALLAKRIDAEIAPLVEALEGIAADYENPNIGHQDFRVRARLVADAAIAKAKQEERRCSSCDGLNTACPDGCGRDPQTGETERNPAMSERWIDPDCRQYADGCECGLCPPTGPRGRPAPAMTEQQTADEIARRLDFRTVYGEARKRMLRDMTGESLDYHLVRVAGEYAIAAARPMIAGEERERCAKLRADIFEILRRHGVSEQCFAEVAMVTHAAIRAMGVEPHD